MTINQPTCPHCGRELKTRHAVIGGRRFTRVERCECVDERLRLDRKNAESLALSRRVRAAIREASEHCSLHIVDAYWMQSLGRYSVQPRNERAVERALEFLSRMGGAPEGPRLVHISGKAEVGKTRLAYAVITECIRAGLGVAIIKAVALAEAFKDGAFRNWLLSPERRVILLDDLGKEVMSGFARDDFHAAYYALVDAVNGDASRGLIQTSEPTLKEWLDRYGPNADALRWRLKNMGGNAQIREEER